MVKMRVNFLCVLFLSLIFLCRNTNAQKFDCPDDKGLAPCTCLDGTSGGGEIVCEGPNITQESVNKAFKLLRDTNGVASTDYLRFTSFKILSSQMSKIDLTPFMRIIVNRVEFYNNSALTGLTGPSLVDNEWLIDTTALHMGKNKLNDAGLGSALKYFSPKLQSLGLSKNNIKGSRVNGKIMHPRSRSNAGQIQTQGKGQRVTYEYDSAEFLPGLSAFTELDYINLYSNQIQSLGNGQFRRNNKLTFLGLENNQIEEIAEEAFLFDEAPAVVLNRALNITLHYNSKLSEETFHTNHGLDKSKRPIALYLHFTKFTTLPEDTFEKYLDAHMDNYVNVNNNTLQCDSRVKWLKDQSDKYMGRVEWTECANDQGQNVFTSHKTDSKNGAFRAIGAGWTAILLFVVLSVLWDF